MMIMNIHEQKDIIEEVIIYYLIKQDQVVKFHKNHMNIEKRDRNLQILINIKIINIIVDFNLKKDIQKFISMIMKVKHIFYIKNQQKFLKVKIDLDQDKEINQIVVIVIKEDLNQHINLKNTVANINENKIYNLLWIKLNQKSFLYQEVSIYNSNFITGPGAGKGT